MITRKQALALGYREELWHGILENADGTPVRCHVNGKCETWKTRPNDWQLPVKHGPRYCFYIGVVSTTQWVDYPDRWYLPAEHPTATAG